MPKTLMQKAIAEQQSLIDKASLTGDLKNLAVAEKKLKALMRRVTVRNNPPTKEAEESKLADIATKNIGTKGK